VTTREEAEAAIRLWQGLGLVQKRLAFRADVSDTTISKILHQPGYTRCAEVYRRISDVVAAEVATHIQSLPMSVVSLCENPPRAFDSTTTAAVVANVKDKMQHLASPASVVMPDGIGGAIVSLGPESAGLFVVAVPTGNHNQRIAALIHELDHLKEHLSRGLRQEFKPPRSAF
jgi:predicted metallopeptidase